VDAIDTSGIKLVVNERYAQTGELGSLACAVDALESDTVISYGDLLFRSYVLRALVESKADFAVVVDSSPLTGSNRTVRDFAYCSRADDRGLFGTPVLLQKIVSGKQPGAVNGESANESNGRWIGMLRVSREGLAKLKAVMTTLRARPDFDTLDMPSLMNVLIADGAQIEVLYVHGHWRGVNDLDELHQAVDFAHAQTPYGKGSA
jgi:phosphoenolpyruvate phosphomutase